VSSKARPIFAYFGHHKCASDWVRRILSELCVLLGLRIFHTHWPLRLPLGFEARDPFRERIRSSRAYCANGDFDFLIATNADRKLVCALEERRFRAFHLIRDPRDIIVSGYFSHLWSHRVHPDENPWLLDHRSQLSALSQEEGILRELEYAATYLERLSQWDYHHPTTYEIRFESLTTDPKAEMRRALAFCGILTGSTAPPEGVFRTVRCSEQAYAAVMDRNSFERLSGGRTPGVRDQHSHFRSGVGGDFRNYFTPAIREKFDHFYPGLVKKLGYEDE
jgi:Sulfotransferase domain